MLVEYLCLIFSYNDISCSNADFMMGYIGSAHIKSILEIGKQHVLDCLTTVLLLGEFIRHLQKA